jgi:hypothetical protein
VHGERFACGVRMARRCQGAPEVSVIWGARSYLAISPTTTRLGGLTITILSTSLANL